MRDRRFLYVSASMSEAAAAVFGSAAQGLTRDSCDPHNCDRHRHVSDATDAMAVRWSYRYTGRDVVQDCHAGSAADRGRTTVMSVAAKSSPVHSTGCPVRSASAYVKQPPKFSQRRAGRTH